MSENEFERNGKVYVAIESSSCNGCAFKSNLLCGEFAPPCGEYVRQDNRNVIFIEKQGEQ